MTTAAGTNAPSGRLARPSAIWIIVVILLLAGLPLALLADLRELSRDALTRQSEEFSRIINDVRNFYAQDVVARVIAADGNVHTSSKFREEPGAIPIPATFSLELGRLIGMVLQPLYLMSGVMFPIHIIPPPYREWIMINPLAHGLEVARSGFAPHYNQIPETSLAYLYLWAIVGVFFGLAMHRYFSKRLSEQ